MGGSGDDSPVESVRRDVLVDELPFPPKVHGAVQLWRHQIREVGGRAGGGGGSLVSKMDACVSSGPASN